MLSKQARMGAVLLGVLLLLLLAAAPISIGVLRPAKGYRKALIELIRPGVIVAPADVVLLRDIRERKVDFVVDYYGFRYRGNTGNHIDANVYYFGAYEKPELNFLRATLASVGPDAVVIDVGANSGLYSVFASKYAKVVHAVEPFPPILARLRTLINENKIGNVVVHAVGLGETEAELPFFSPPEGNLGTGSFVAGFSKRNRDEHLSLRIVPGDVYFTQAGITRIDFIKMDIEGYEKPALAGLQKTLGRHRPIVLMEISINPDLPKLFKSLQELKAAFPKDYEFFELTDENSRTGAYRLQPFQRSFQQQDHFNIVARPNEKAGLIPVMFDGRSERNP